MYIILAGRKFKITIYCIFTSDFEKNRKKKQNNTYDEPNQDFLRENFNSNLKNKKKYAKHMVDLFQG